MQKSRKKSKQKKLKKLKILKGGGFVQTLKDRMSFKLPNMPNMPNISNMFSTQIYNLQQKASSHMLTIKTKIGDNFSALKTFKNKILCNSGGKKTFKNNKHRNNIKNKNKN